MVPRPPLTTHSGWLSPDPAKQLDPVGLFEQADLPADGLWRQVQLLTRPNDAAGLGHNPEVMQLPIIEHGGLSS